MKISQFQLPEEIFNEYDRVVLDHSEVEKAPDRLMFIITRCDAMGNVMGRDVWNRRKLEWKCSTNSTSNSKANGDK